MDECMCIFFEHILNATEWVKDNKTNVYYVKYINRSVVLVQESHYQKQIDFIIL